MARNFRITIDTHLNWDINVHLNEGTSIISNQCSRGIYYYDKANMEHNIINNQVNDYTLLNTVDRKKAYFPQREFKEADRSRIMQQLVGEP